MLGALNRILKMKSCRLWMRMLSHLMATSSVTCSHPYVNRSQNYLLELQESKEWSFHTQCQGVDQKLQAKHSDHLGAKIKGKEADDARRRIGMSDWIRSEARGFSSGIWVFGNREVIELKVIYVELHFIHLLLKEDDGRAWSYQ